jgi:hypothetical protein
VKWGEKMSRWQELYDQHAIHATLRELLEIVKGDVDNIDDAEFSERRRFRKIISSLQNILSIIDPEVVPFNQLDGLNNSLRHQSLFHEVVNFSNNNNLGHLINANDHLSSQETLLTPFGYIASDHEKSGTIVDLEVLVDAFSKKVVKRRQEIEKGFSGLFTKTDDLENKLLEVSDNAETRRKETDAQMSQWQQQFSESQEERRKEYGEQISKIDDQLSSWRADFSTDQDTRTVEHNKWKDGVKKNTGSDVSEMIRKTQSMLDSHQEAYEEQIKRVIEDSDAKHKAILDLYQLAAGDSVAGGYLQNADQERKAANRWRLTSVGFIFGTVLWLLIAGFSDFTITADGGILWSKVALAFSLTGVMLFGAAYSAQQSTRHRNNEKRTRWFALEVKAIDPFISSLPEEQQQTLKRDLSDRLFGQSTHGTDDGAKMIDEHALKVVVKSVSDILKNIPKG